MKGKLCPIGKHTEKEKSKEPVVVRLDVDNISQRILALPIPARNYVDLAAAKTAAAMTNGASRFAFITGHSLH